MEGNRVEIGDTHQIVFFEKCSDEVNEFRKRKDVNPGKLIPLVADQGALKEILVDAGKKVPEGSIVDVYNPSITFIQDGNEYIAGRTELSEKANELESLIVFFRHEGENWIPLKQPVFEMQDPNISRVNGKFFLSGVELSPDSKKKGRVLYRTVFYEGPDFENLTRFDAGPWGMKGIRLIELPNGEIGVYTRPQGKKGGPGQIGFTTVKGLEDLRGHLAEIADAAPLLNYQFPKKEWGGLNQTVNLTGNLNLVIGHRAYRDHEPLNPLDKIRNYFSGKKSPRHYIPWTAVHNFKTGEVTDLGNIAERANFPEGRAKAPDLKDVLYTSGVVIKENKWFLIVGISDTQSGVVEITNPLLKFPSLSSSIS